jgi:hypothetical protein
MENPLYIVSLSKAGFDFSNLPPLLQKSSSWVLSAPKEYNAQVELLDDATYQALTELYPNNNLLKSISDIKPLINQDLANNYNTMAYDPNELLPATLPMDAKCFNILSEENYNLNQGGWYIQTTYIDETKEPQVISCIYYTHTTFVENKLDDIFDFLMEAFKKEFNIKYPTILANKVGKLFRTDPIKWDNSIMEVVGTNILLFNDREVVCTHKEPLKD